MGEKLSVILEVGHFMRQTDHVQKRTSWCEIKHTVSIKLETVGLRGKTVRVSRYFYTAINSTNDRERSDNSWWPTDCTAIYFVPWARRRYSASTASPDCCRQLQGMTFFCIPTLALYFASDQNIHSALLLRLYLLPPGFLYVVTRSWYMVWSAK